jgi:hypothetical protein
MHVDGDIECYRFIWDRVDEGWGLYSYPPLYGVKIHFRQTQPSASDLKQIREHWERVKNKPVSAIKSLLGPHSYVIGKWSRKRSEEVWEKVVRAGCHAEIVEVPHYTVVHMKTGEVAQIRQADIYDAVVDALIKNGTVITPLSGIYAEGGCIWDD